MELRTLTSQRSCRFEVTDLGPGILPADADRLFEPFQRGQEQEAGTGLGLAVVGAIARAHQGSAGVRSEGEATTFWIEVPR